MGVSRRGPQRSAVSILSKQGEKQAERCRGVSSFLAPEKGEKGRTCSILTTNLEKGRKATMEKNKNPVDLPFH